MIRVSSTGRTEETTTSGSTSSSSKSSAKRKTALVVAGWIAIMSDLARRADRLRYVLPPRPAGTQALLRGAPDADVVVLANVGTENLSSIAEIIDTITEPHPIVVHATRHERATVPDDPDAFAEWLVERWLEMDDWIHDRVTEGLPMIATETA